MPSFQTRLPSRRTVFRTISFLVVAGILLVIGLGVWGYFEAVKRFEVRRVSLPTRIYADLFPLRPGVSLTPGDLEDKLGRLGYREVETVKGEGEYTKSHSTFDIYLRSFRYPTGKHDAERIEVELADGRIRRVSVQGGGAVETAALEPELLTSILTNRLENRRPVNLDQVPQNLIDAVVVTEDIRFWSHPGVDPIGIVRALVRNIRSGGVAEGGSTLTQQLVKNYYLSNERTLRRKIIEAFMAIILDARYSKKEILEAYLNDIYLGRNRSISIIGVGEAARYYFGKPVAELQPAESALIAGMIRSPNNYSPFADADAAKKRRNTVLGLMLKYHKIDRSEYEKAIAKELPKKPGKQRTGLGSIPYYVDEVVQEVSDDYGIGNVRGRGLSIYTAINLDWQDEATNQIRQGLHALERSSRRLRRADSPLQGVLIAVDVPTGEIRALVGGRDYNESQFNRALQAKRQVGSLFKPFVYLAAFEPSLSHQVITPATLVNDQRFVLKRRFSKDWSPHNYEGVYHGIVTVEEALVHSMNVASVRIGLATGIDSIIRAAHALGIETELDSVPSLILGSVEIPPIEMAEAYSTIARLGSRLPLHTIRYITDDNGRLVSKADFEPVQVFPDRDVYVGVHIMEDVVTHGTAAGSRQWFRKTAAGKTGTTNDKRDAWFIGFTPETLALTWVGFDDNKPTGLAGSEGAVPIWAKFMNEATKDQQDRDFPVPSGIVFVPVDVSSGGLATPYCPEDLVRTVAFKAGTAPTQECQVHQPPPPPPMQYPYGQGLPYSEGMPPGMTGTGLPPSATMPPEHEPILGPGNIGTPPMMPPTRTQPPPTPTQTQAPPTQT
ncbi:MAG: PBP1A family penicillin-binding protein, partial [Thermoanaerobaculia bacterium]